MTEHYTRNTLEVTAWCNRCARQTQHRVDAGRQGPCLEHTAPELTQEQKRRRDREARARLQPPLFPPRTP